MVAFTDGYHLTNLFTHVADLATLTVALKSKDGWKWRAVAKKVLLSAAANSLAFYISYDKIYR